MKALFAGSFSPPTCGHLDIIRRGSALFGELVVAVLSQEGKQYALPPEKRALYDTERMGRDQRNNFFIWAAVFAAGAALSLLVSQGLAIAAFVVWLVLFLRDVHFDAEKAFAKYKK